MNRPQRSLAYVCGDIDATLDPLTGMGNTTTEQTIIHFFVPLREPLALPDGFLVEVQLSESWDAYLDRIRADDEYGGQADPDPAVVVGARLRFWQGSRPSSESDILNHLLQTARRALPSLPPSEPSDASRLSEPLQEGTTVVEIEMPLAANSEDDRSDAFDRGIAVIRIVQRAYHLLRREPVTLIARQQLPSIVPLVTCRWSERGEESCELGLMLLHLNVALASRGPELSPAELEQLEHAIEIQPSARVFASYADLVRHAGNTLDREGDTKAAVLFAAIAAEVLLDDLLAHMLWEEGTRPEEAARIFDSGFQTRVRQQFHARLGGAGWGLDKPGVPLDWQDRIARLRHRVVHSGYEPTGHEAAQATAALRALDSFVAGRICTEKALRKYARTAMALLGRSELQRRDRWSKRLQRLAEDPSEVNWADTFMRWKAAMNRCRSEPPPGTLEPDIARALVVGVVHPPHALTWVLHDRAASMACRARPPENLSDGQSAALARIIADTPEDAAPVSIAMFGARAEPLDGHTWVQEYRLIPMAGVMVTGKDLDSP